MRSEVDTGCSSVVHLFHLIFETKSLINLDLTDSARMVGQQASPSGFAEVSRQLGLES